MAHNRYYEQQLRDAIKAACRQAITNDHVKPVAVGVHPEDFRRLGDYMHGKWDMDTSIIYYSRWVPPGQRYPVREVYLVRHSEVEEGYALLMDKNAALAAYARGHIEVDTDLLLDNETESEGTG